MTFSQWLVFIVIDTLIHILVVKWEVKTNKDLFVDLECRPLFLFNKKKKERGRVEVYDKE